MDMQFYRRSFSKFWNFLIFDTFKLTPFVSKNHGTSTMKSHGIRFTVTFQIKPKDGTAFNGFDSDSDSRESRRPTDFNIVQLNVFNEKCL